MLLLHTSDWHLGMQRTQTATYQKDHEYFLARLCELIDARHVDAVLLSGQAGGTDRVRVERVGINLRDAVAPDSAGRILRDTPIFDAAPRPSGSSPGPSRPSAQTEVCP